MPWPAAFRRIAGDVSKLTLLVATRTLLRRGFGCQGIAAFTAFPKCLTALRADIILKWLC